MCPKKKKDQYVSSVPLELVAIALPGNFLECTFSSLTPTCWIKNSECGACNLLFQQALQMIWLQTKIWEPLLWQNFVEGKNTGTVYSNQVYK